MAITEESRQDLFQLFESTYGREGALLIMDFLPPVGWADVATKRDLDAQTELLSRDILATREELQRLRVSQDLMATRQETVAMGELLSRDILATRQDMVAMGELVSRDILATRQDMVAMGELVSRDILATRQDMVAMGELVSRDILATRQDMVAMGDRLSGDIEGAKLELRAEIAGLEVRMLNAFGSLTRAMILGLILALIGMVATAVGLG